MANEKRAPGATVKMSIVVALIVVVGGVLFAKNRVRESNPGANSNSALTMTQPAAQEQTAAEKDVPTALPRLVDLGADKCIPCKMMAPILEELKEEYKDRMEVEFVDVWKNPDAGKAYGISVIPTQIFYDADGKELFRHQGFISKEDILAQWKELGVDLH